MVIMVTLDEQDDLHVVGTMVDCAPEDMRLDMAVEVVFDDVTDDVTLPRWRLVDV